MRPGHVAKLPVRTMKSYKVKIECPIEKFGDMLYELLEDKMARYMMYCDYWHLLTLMNSYDSSCGTLRDHFTSERAYDDFVDACDEIRGGVVSAFDIVTGCVDVERGDGDSEICLSDVVNEHSVKPGMLDSLLPWVRKDLKYIVDWVASSLESKYDDGGLSCSLYIYSFDWGSTITMELTASTESVARYLNRVKGAFEVLAEVAESDTQA